MVSGAQVCLLKALECVNRNILMFGQGQGPSTSGPPYAPQNFALGGVPDVIPDIPITAVFLFLYVVFAIVHFIILKKGQRRGHKFVFSGALFGEFGGVVL